MTLRGPRGIGVSALAEAAAVRAAGAGMRVLRARGVQAESSFPYAGLDQLLRPLRRRHRIAATPGPEDVAGLAGDAFVCVDELAVDRRDDPPGARPALVPALFAGHDDGPRRLRGARSGRSPTRPPRCSPANCRCSCASGSCARPPDIPWR